MIAIRFARPRAMVFETAGVGVHLRSTDGALVRAPTADGSSNSRARSTLTLRRRPHTCSPTTWPAMRRSPWLAHPRCPPRPRWTHPERLAESPAPGTGASPARPRWRLWSRRTAAITSSFVPQPRAHRRASGANAPQPATSPSRSSPR
jgi:hypothetical protein